MLSRPRKISALLVLLALVVGCGEKAGPREEHLEFIRAAVAVGIHYGRDTERFRHHVSELLQEEERPEVRVAMEERLAPAADPILAGARQVPSGLLITLAGSNSVVGEYSLTYLVDHDGGVRDVTNEGQDARDFDR